MHQVQRITSLRESGLHALPSTGRYESVSDYFLKDESHDLRGRKVMIDNREAGIVRHMLANPDTQTVAMIELSDGRRVPIKYIRLHGSQVRVGANV